jgi:hypothetical protein
MKLDELLNVPANNLNKLYLDMFDGDANAANLALQNDLKLKTPGASLIGKKPRKLNKVNLQNNLRNAEVELKKQGLHPTAAQNLLQLKKEHGVR